MQTQKSAVPAATGHDAKSKSTQMNSNPNLATNSAKIKLTRADRARVRSEYQGALDELDELFSEPVPRTLRRRLLEHRGYYDQLAGLGRLVVPCELCNGPGCHACCANGPTKTEENVMDYEPIKRPRISAEDPIDVLRLLVVRLVQCASHERISGFYSVEMCGSDAAVVRWIEGFHDELVCQVRFTHQQALFLASVADAHELLQRAFKTIDFTVLIVEGFIRPTCPHCDGEGSIWVEARFLSSEHVGIILCETCKGSGEVGR